MREAQCILRIFESNVVDNTGFSCHGRSSASSLDPHLSRKTSSSSSTLDSCTDLPNTSRQRWGKERTSSPWSSSPDKSFSAILARCLAAGRPTAVDSTERQTRDLKSLFSLPLSFTVVLRQRREHREDIFLPLGENLGDKCSIIILSLSPSSPFPLLFFLLSYITTALDNSLSLESQFPVYLPLSSSSFSARSATVFTMEGSMISVAFRTSVATSQRLAVPVS